MGCYFIHHFLERKRSNSSQPAFRHKINNEWISYTWDDVYRRCNTLICYMNHITEGGSYIGILGKNSLNWIIVDYSCLLSDRISLPFHIWMDRERLLHHLSFVSLLFVDSGFIPFVRGEFPDERIVTLDRKVVGFTFLGEIFDRETKEDFIEKYERDIREDEVTTVLFTSGNRGNCTGSLITQGALAFELNSLKKMMIYDASTDEQMIFMPFSQTLGRLAEILPVAYGFPTAIVNLVDASKLASDMKEVQPTVMVAYPDYFIYLKNAFEQIFETAPLYKKVGFEALAHLKLENNKLAKKFKELIKNTIKTHIGKNIRFFICGGGKLDRAIIEFFDNLKIPILLGYGMAETSGATHMNTLERRKVGSVGLPLEGVETRIGDDGYICIRGPNLLKGYLNGDRTPAITPDGWLKTDDMGEIDEDGFLFIKS
ncbi:MAG: AMP-binding protein [Deltaproteobacteria bacterium]|nr:AMP-binding protein [Deltaproteobacteria bacterium]